jgi:tetratricopeptide (TPR) repeat protein
VARLEAALAGQPESPALQSAAGRAYEQAGRWEASLAARERALALAPEAPLAQNDLAWGLAQTGRELDRALDLAQRAQRAAPQAVETIDTLALVRLRRKEPAAALAGLDAALANGAPALPILDLRRGQALAALGRKAEARHFLERAEPGLSAAGPAWAAEGKALAQQLGWQGD